MDGWSHSGLASESRKYNKLLRGRYVNGVSHQRPAMPKRMASFMSGRTDWHGDGGMAGGSGQTRTGRAVRRVLHRAADRRRPICSSSPALAGGTPASAVCAPHETSPRLAWRRRAIKRRAETPTLERWDPTWSASSKISVRSDVASSAQPLFSKWSCSRPAAEAHGSPAQEDGGRGDCMPV